MVAINKCRVMNCYLEITPKNGSLETEASHYMYQVKESTIKGRINGNDLHESSPEELLLPFLILNLINFLLQVFSKTKNLQAAQQSVLSVSHAFINLPT